MPVRIIATYEQPVEHFGEISGDTYYVSPGVTVKVECGPDTIAAAMTALDWAVAEVKAELAAADPMCKGFVYWPENSHSDSLILEFFTKNAWRPDTLTPEELRLDSEPLTIDPRPKPVRAWVRFGPKPLLVDAVAVRWTADAVGVVFSIRETEYRAWVWASAVTPVRRTP